MRQVLKKLQKYFNKILLLHFSLLTIVLASEIPTVKNLQVSQQDDEIELTYDLDAHKGNGAEILLRMTTDGGDSWRDIKEAQGDLGKGIYAGTAKQIRLDMHELFPNGISGQLNFKVETKAERDHRVADDPNYLSDWEPKISFDGRMGAIEVNNTSPYVITVHLWHPDSKTLFRSYKVKGQSRQELLHSEIPIVIGSDWGIQVGSKKSRVKTLSNVATWKNNDWYLDLASFY